MPEGNGTIKTRLKAGWLPDYPDFRDYTLKQSEVSRRLKQIGDKKPVKNVVKELGIEKPKKGGVKASVDLREWCSPIEDQEEIGSCTAHAGVGVLEYYERRAHGTYIDASRLFLYKVTRRLMHLGGDTGASIRSTMKAMVLFGVPPEEYWPYLTDHFDEEPPAFCYAFAQNYQALQYFRLDPMGTPRDELLKQIKACLGAGLPAMFGFTVFSSRHQALKNKGKIPFPCRGEEIEGGHAVIAVGYDDKLKIKNDICGHETKGAVLIRNSWGTDWGEDGYGWLPYEYILKGIAVDWWVLFKNEWIDTKKFGD
jgi:C1A family cysteine protease